MRDFLSYELIVSKLLNRHAYWHLQVVNNHTHMKRLTHLLRTELEGYYHLRVRLHSTTRGKLVRDIQATKNHVHTPSYVIFPAAPHHPFA